MRPVTDGFTGECHSEAGVSFEGGTSTASSTRNFPFSIRCMISSMRITESSNFTLTVDVAAFSLKAMTSVFVRIELILALPDQFQHPETFRS